jgi:hypothetical protein
MDCEVGFRATLPDDVWDEGGLKTDESSLTIEDNEEDDVQRL